MNMKCYGVRNCKTVHSILGLTGETWSKPEG